MLKKTPLHSAHQNLGARLVEFGGWEMPVQYTSIMDEHQAVRRAAGIFDISHMGEIFIRGPKALEFINGLLTNDAAKLTPGEAQYTLMCNDQGGVIDDLYLYCLQPEEYLLIVNASRIEADYDWIKSRFADRKYGVGAEMRNASDDFGAVAVQGPATVRFIDKCFRGNGASKALPSELKKNQALTLHEQGQEVYVARTGYTGEDGFEVVAPASRIGEFWARLLQEGKGYGLVPAGLGARDTLRTEMCYPLYGHELDESTTPIQAGLGFFVALQKGEFAGRSVLAREKESGPAKKCAAFKMTGKSPPPRPGYAVEDEAGAKLGTATSGTLSPSLGIGIGMAYVPPEKSKAGQALKVEIRGQRYGAEIAPKPIYRKAS